MLEQITTHEQPLSQRTAEEIIEHIKTSGLKSGDRMPNETILCTKLKVSRSTLREAIKLLVSRNILRISRGIGTFVSSNLGVTDDPLGLDFIKDKAQVIMDLMQFRFFIEPSLVKLAAQNANQDEIDNLCALEEKLEEAYKNKQDTTLHDIQFHTVIAKCSHNLVVEIIFPILIKAIPAVNQYTQKSLMDDTISDHKAIIQAIKDKNAQLAEVLMVQHLKRNTEFISKKMAK